MSFHIPGKQMEMLKKWLTPTLTFMSFQPVLHSLKKNIESHIFWFTLTYSVRKELPNHRICDFGTLKD